MDDETARPDEPDDVVGAQATPSAPPEADDDTPPEDDGGGDDDTGGHRIYAHQVGVDLDASA